MHYPPDHGLPLVQLKELRREMVVALQNRPSPLGDEELRQIAIIQQAISAFEEVIADLDYEVDERSAAADQRALRFPAFGRRGMVHAPI